MLKGKESKKNRYTNKVASISTFGPAVLQINYINFNVRLTFEKSNSPPFTWGWYDVELFRIENQKTYLFFWHHTSDLEKPMVYGFF